MESYIGWKLNIVPTPHHLVSLMSVIQEIFMSDFGVRKLVSKLPSGTWLRGDTSLPLVHYITLYERYHFFGPPCSFGTILAIVIALCTGSVKAGDSEPRPD